MAQVNFRIDDDIKREADELFSRLGINMTTAITIFIRKSLNTRGIPFSVSDDPFYAPANQAYLERAVRDMDQGVNCHFHELIDPDENAPQGAKPRRSPSKRVPQSKRSRHAKALA